MPHVATQIDEMTARARKAMVQIRDQVAIMGKMKADPRCHIVSLRICSEDYKIQVLFSFATIASATPVPFWATFARYPFRVMVRRAQGTTLSRNYFHA